MFTLLKPIIEIKEISKKFQIQSNTKPYLSLRENLFSFLKPGSKKEEFWALNNVSFDVMPGDSVGIIGKNGAGKSTLLKILSKITPPTSGKIVSRGRIASLLEVGTGFHPELSGRENVFMNGSILGMRRAEIVKNFDAIVDFSGIDKFIDTPLKHYSSGMQLRLAFAVAAFLENEILIIDEVLAVGDAEFQKKCMGKMEDVSKSGRTILFVSHNMGALQSLCKHAVLLDKGHSSEVLPAQQAVGMYLNKTSGGTTEKTTNDRSRKANIQNTVIRNTNNEIVQRVNTYEDFFVDITWFNYACEKVNVAIEFHNYSGKAIMFAADTPIDWYGDKKEKNKQYKSTVKIPKNYFKGDEYFIRPCLITSSPIELIDIDKDGVHISIVDPLNEHCIARGDFKELFEPFTHLSALEWSNEITV
ncbi:MAG: ABC transporter ATP-binding protein [Bacteroidia bacterium]|nr:ABC transporter ATP-binding protein [Bacteroidia bacterium]